MKLSKLNIPFSILVAATGLLASCNDDVENVPVKDYPEQTTPTLTSHKVMWVIMDGANGSVVNYARNNQYAPFIRKMTENALYTFNGLADKTTEDVVTKELGWANLMTGVSDHGVKDESGLSAISTPTVVERIETDDSRRSTMVMGADASFVDTFGRMADNRSVGSDNTLYDDVTRILTGNETPDFLVVEFSGVREAGLEYGFKDEAGLRPTPEILAAVNKMDGYIGQFGKLIDARSKQHNEKWLLIVTSSYGGMDTNAGESVYDMADRNTFGMIYNYDFNSEVMLQPGDDELKYNYYIPVFNDYSDGPYAEVMDDTLFDIEFDKDALRSNGSYTIQFMYKQVNKGWESQHAMVSKGTRLWPGTGEGWAIQNDYFRPLVICEGMYIYGQSGGVYLNTGDWHTSTIVFDGSKAKCYIYIDAVLANNGGNPGSLSRNVTHVNKPLRIGRQDISSGREGGPFYITNVQFYDTAIPEEDIKRFNSYVQLDERRESFKYWDNLIGYWPLDREEDFYKDKAPDYSKYGSIYGGENAGRSDMRLYRVTSWTSGSDLSENVQPMPSSSYYQAVFNNVDFIIHTLQWLDISLDMNWEFEGVAHKLPYKNL